MNDKYMRERIHIIVDRADSKMLRRICPILITMEQNQKELTGTEVRRLWIYELLRSADDKQTENIWYFLEAYLS